MEDVIPEIASPDGALSFLFSVFALLMWFTQTSVLGWDNLFSIGVIQIVLAFGALAASIINALRGKPRSNINLIATFLLGFFPGFRTLMALIAQSMGMNFSFQVFGLMYIVGSIFSFGVAVRRYFKPLYRFLGTLCIGMGLLLSGLGDLITSSSLAAAGGWFLMLFALQMFYYGLSVMYIYYGSRLPQGASMDELLKRKSTYEK